MNFGSTPEEIENQRKRLLLLGFVSLGSLLLTTFAIVSFVNQRHTLGLVLIAFVLVIVATGLLAHRLKRVQPVCIVLAVVLLALASFLVLTGAAEGTGAYWSYIPSMLMVLLVGPKVGIGFMVVYLAILTPCLKGQFDFVYPYPDIASTRILASSVGLYVLILISEWIRVGSYSAITFTSENFREQANTDALTGLLNRHGVKSVLRRQEFEQPAVLALIDVDRFKSVNDSFGHDTGDEVLIALAKVLKANTKGGDVAARWGGEEFLLVLFGSNLQTSARLLEKIKSRFTAQCFQSSNQSFSSSFSAGLAELANAGDFEAAIRKADELLYQAKTTGRDHIVY